MVDAMEEASEVKTHFDYITSGPFTVAISLSHLAEVKLLFSQPSSVLNPMEGSNYVLQTSETRRYTFHVLGAEGLFK